MTVDDLVEHPRDGTGVRSPRRLLAVHDTGLLESGPEEAFNRLTRLASALLGTPLVFLTVVDEVRSFLKGAPEPELLCGPDGTFSAPAHEAACHVTVDNGVEITARDVREDPRLRDLPQIRQFGVAAWAGVPFTDPAGQVLGNLCAFDTNVRTWSEADMDAMRTLAAAASGEVALRLALRDSRARAAQAAELAQTLRESLVPAHPPRIPGIEIAAVFRPGGTGIEVLGDFYDVLPVEGGFGVVIGDVSGHGPAAARTTAMARSAVRTSSHIESEPTTVLSTLNEVLALWFGERRGFISAAYVTFHRPARDDSAWRVLVANAGHPPGFLHRADGTVERLAGGGRVLGITQRGAVAEQRLELGPGDSLVLYTDGIIEARDPAGTELDEAGVVRTLAAAPAGASPQALADTLVGAAVEHSGAGVLADDAAVVVIGISPPAP